MINLAKCFECHIKPGVNKHPVKAIRDNPLIITNIIQSTNLCNACEIDIKEIIKENIEWLSKKKKLVVNVNEISYS